MAEEVELLAAAWNDARAVVSALVEMAVVEEMVEPVEMAETAGVVVAVEHKGTLELPKSHGVRSGSARDPGRS